MPRKSLQERLLSEIAKVLGDIGDIVVENDTLEVPLELTDSPKWDQIESILHKHSYYVSYVTKNTIVYRRSGRLTKR